jgi:glycosyltransferase involved in cell wall biosynthesis
MRTLAPVARPVPVLVLYHRSQTFGGSFNSVLDVLSRVDRGRFAVTAAVPGPGNARDAIAQLGFPVHFLAERPGSRTAGFVAAVATAWLCLRQHRTALVYVADYVAWRSSLLLAARLGRVPSVVHVRSPLGEDPLDPELLRATIIVGNSEASIRALRAHRPEGSIRVVHNFIDFASFDGARDRRREIFGEQPPVVGFLGVFRPEKGIEYYLQMARLVAAIRPDVRFLAVGGESAVSDIGWFPRMRQLAVDLGIESLVHFTGSRDDVPDMMKSMDVLVVPSLNEGFGRVIIEANAVGVPVVGADAAGIPEVIEHGRTGLLVPPRDPEGLADAVIRLLDDTTWRRRLSHDLPDWVRARFSPQEQMQALQKAWFDAMEYRSRA